MLKYKCVKRYPNGPDIGTIVTKDALGQYVQEHPLWIHSWEEIENFTEFWEEVKEKEFEILEYEGKCCMCDGTCPTRRDDCKIYKVKRLSDLETFSLGDKVYWDWIQCSRKYFTIKSFKIGSEGELRFDTIESSPTDFNAEYCKIKHYKEPLFLDELGNEIVEGSTIWVTESLNTPWCSRAIFPKNSSYWNIFTDRRENTKIFVNKADCENYINENKPMFSKKQILDALEWGYLHSIVATEMYRAVKIKLDL